MSARALGVLILLATLASFSFGQAFAQESSGPLYGSVSSWDQETPLYGSLPSIQVPSSLIFGTVLAALLIIGALVFGKKISLRMAPPLLVIPLLVVGVFGVINLAFSESPQTVHAQEVVVTQTPATPAEELDLSQEAGGGRIVDGEVVLEGDMSEETPEPESTQEPQKEEEKKKGKCKVSNNFPSDVLQWCDEITRFAKKTSLDPDLLAALIWQESGGNPVAYSKSGAVGLMQVMPRDGIAASFMCVNGPCFTNRPTIAELQDPAFNIQYGTGMLANLVAKYGNTREALRYYGPRDVGYYYADKVLAIYENYRK
jgi:hypothetical protein